MSEQGAPVERPDLEEIQEQHQAGGWELCTTCMDKEGENSLSWPCDAYQAAEYAYRLERQAEAVRAYLAEMVVMAGQRTSSFNPAASQAAAMGEIARLGRSALDVPA